jgi:uncharacterized membrane protein YkoI
MKRHFKISSLAFVLLFTLFSATVALAESEISVSKQQAVNIAQQFYPGRVLAVKLKGNIYQVKTLNDSGEVRIITVDAKTGQVLSDK